MYFCFAFPCLASSCPARSTKGSTLVRSPDLILIRVLPASLFRRIAPATCANDLPLETAGDRCEPLGADGMWTKCGPDTPARGAAPLRMTGPCRGKAIPAGYPTSKPCHDNRLARETWRNLSRDTPWIDGLSLASRVVPPALSLFNHAPEDAPSDVSRFAPSWSAVPANVLAVPDAVSFGAQYFYGSC
jgi:hypothetical protein